ncbi:MAG: radical SAM protein [Bryobacteraceae bacterium]|nr:radical SAM protein [Bryobacteraceae bacterium]
MNAIDLLRAWRVILAGRRPSLAIEITRECPLSCPGCYAYDSNHLGGNGTLRELSDYQGPELIRRVLLLVNEHNPLHVSFVGGEPLVRYRELNTIIPLLLGRGIHIRLVTSAVRPIPSHWALFRNFDLAVSVDGLMADHDARRSPAIYSRILKHIQGQKVTIHCTVTGPMMRRPGYLDEFLAFWAPRKEVKRVWFSLFTPQRGASLAEMLTAADRQRFIQELPALRRRYPELDLSDRVEREFASPPASPEECIFAQTTRTVSADLHTPVTPCQLGGDPDCAQCGCYASMGLAAVGNYRIAGLLPIAAILRASQNRANARRERAAPPNVVTIQPRRI